MMESGRSAGVLIDFNSWQAGVVLREVFKKYNNIIIYIVVEMTLNMAK